jgi:hypothetical protein
VEHQASPRPEASDYFRSSEAVQARHIDIEQHGVGVVLRHEPYSLDPVACFADDGHVRKEAKQSAEQLTENRIIVRENDAGRRR